MNSISNNLTTKAVDVKTYFEGHFLSFYQKYLELQNGNGAEHKAVCPFHPDTDPSLSVNSETGQFHCFGCHAEGDLFSFYGKLKGLSSFPEIVKGIAGDFNILASNGNHQNQKPKGKIKRQITATYSYRDEKKKILFKKDRIEPGYNGKDKTFVFSRLDDKKGWIKEQGCMNGARMVLYHLHMIVKHPKSPVIACEGEKDADNVQREFKLLSTTNSEGAGTWRHEYSEALRGRDVIILPDNDESGRNHFEKVAKSLHGIAKSIRVLELPGLPAKGDVSDWIQAGGTKEAFQKLVEDCPLWEPEEDPSTAIKKQFPRGSFPWEVLPPDIARSLKQLARSCATSSTSLPGAAIAIFASLIGVVASVCSKTSWIEPLIFWFMDIRNSGTGKTPAARALCRTLYVAQKNVDEIFKNANLDYFALSKKERQKQGIEMPPRPRGYFATDLTLEGLREDLQGHGGQVIILDELSSFISAQNQYKAKGNDRESWLCLHDGNPARVVRAGKSITIQKSRVSIFGGIQPTIWRDSFTGEAGKIFQFDGTIFRFLPVYEGEGFHPLTAESWSDENQDAWEELLSMAMDWGNRKHEADENHNLMLTDGAREIFLDWGNELKIIKPDLPEQVKGFVPKLIGSSLRFAGVLYLMDVFSRGEMPGKILGPVDIRKGIKVSEFYLGHIIAAMEALVSANAETPFEITDQVFHLAKTLEGLRDQVDGGLLAVGFIWENFNNNCVKELSIKSEKAMGSVLRDCQLTVVKKKHANGRHGVNCLKWDNKTKHLIERSPQSPQSPQSQENRWVICEDVKKTKSSRSSNAVNGDAKMRTSRTLRKQSPHSKVVDSTRNEDIEDIEDIVSKANEKTDLDWRF